MNMSLEDYADHTYFYIPEIPEWLVEQIDRKPFSTVLDLGCGDGTFLGGLAQAGRLTGKNVYAVDGAQRRVERIQRRFPNFTALKADAADVSQVAGQSIDLLISTQVIEHVEDDTAMVQEMARLLRPGGLFYLTTVFKAWYGWYYHRCNGHWRLDPTHVREYRNDQELLPILEKHGLEVFKQRKVRFSYPVADFVFRRVVKDPEIYGARWAQWARKVTLPIVGYYNWEIVGQRK